MSTLNEREAALRRALQSAAASIEPAPDGLERIQARLGRPRPVVIAWLEAAWTDICLRAQDGLQTAVPLLAEGMRRLGELLAEGMRQLGELLAEGMRRLAERFAPTSEPGRAVVFRWLRPLAAMSLAIFVIAAGTYVGLNGSALLSAGNSLNSGKVSPGASSPGPRGQRNPAGSGTPISQSGGPSSSPTPSGCTKTPKPGRYSGPPTVSPSASATPSATGSPSSTGSPTSTPTPTQSSSPSATPNPGNTTSANGAGTGGAAAGQPGSAVVSLAGHAAAAPTASTTTSTSRRHRNPTASPSATPTRSPCASKTTAAIVPPVLQWLPGRGPISQASAQLAAASLETTVAAARLEATVAATRLNRHSAS